VKRPPTGQWVLFIEGILHSCFQESCNDLEISVSADLLHNAAAALMSAAAAPDGDGFVWTGDGEKGRDHE